MNKEIEDMPYEKFVGNLVKPGQDIIDSLTPQSMNLLHMAVGVSGEAGELIDAVKKHVVYEKELDVTNIIEELGDLEFYMQEIRSMLGVSREIVIHANKAKLSERYKKLHFTNEAAQDRADKKPDIPVNSQIDK